MSAEIDVLARVLFRLPMQWLMIAIFRRQDMRDQAGTGAAPPDGKVRHRGLHDRLTGSAGQFRAYMTDDAECARNVVKDLGLVRAQDSQLAAARGATAILATRGGMGDDITWQRRWKRPTHRFAPVVLGIVRNRLVGRRDLGQLLVDLGKQQIQLLDPRAEFFRGASEGHARQPGQSRLQCLDFISLFDQARARGREFRPVFSTIARNVAMSSGRSEASSGMAKPGR
jgi:hypothetical protein